jgi:hypothetical protein
VLLLSGEGEKRWVCAVATHATDPVFLIFAEWPHGSGHRVSDRRDQGRRADMAEIKIIYDREGKTLTVWFTERSREYTCEETGDEVVHMKDETGRVLGFEKLNFSIPQSDSLRVALETVPA